ncbi:MAG: hypothetical protein L0922_06625 [Candidatus Mariimomonas ferrooxydans]
MEPMGNSHFYHSLLGGNDYEGKRIKGLTNAYGQQKAPLIPRPAFCCR